MGVIRVLVIAPHPLLREGIRLSLSGSRLELVGEAADQFTGVSAARDLDPQACLVDADLPGGGVATVRALVRACPTAAVVVLADRYSDADLLDALRAGAVGYLDKDIKSARLPSVVLAAVAGEAIVPRRLVGQLTREVRLRASEQIGARTPLQLTRRESEVLDLMQDGLSTAGIAERLFVSPGTVRSHVMSLMRKLRVTDRAALMSGNSRPPVATPWRR